MQGLAKKMRLEEVYLLTYRQWNNGCIDALHLAAKLPSKWGHDLDLWGNKQPSKLPELGGASIFVSGSVYPAVLRELQSEKLNKHHIIVSEHLMPFVEHALQDHRANTGFKARLRPPPRSVVYTVRFVQKK